MSAAMDSHGMVDGVEVVDAAPEWLTHPDLAADTEQALDDAAAGNTVSFADTSAFLAALDNVTD